MYPYRQKHARMLLHLYRVQRLQGRANDAKETLLKAETEAAGFFDADHSGQSIVEDMPLMKEALAELFLEEGDTVKARDSFTAAIELLEKLTAYDPANQQANIAFAVTLMKAGELDVRSRLPGDLEKGVARLRRSAEIAAKTIDAVGADSHHRYVRAKAFAQLAFTQMKHPDLAPGENFRAMAIADIRVLKDMKYRLPDCEILLDRLGKGDD